MKFAPALPHLVLAALLAGLFAMVPARAEEPADKKTGSANGHW